MKKVLLSLCALVFSTSAFCEYYDDGSDSVPLQIEVPSVSTVVINVPSIDIVATEIVGSNLEGELTATFSFDTNLADQVIGALVDGTFGSADNVFVSTLGGIQNAQVVTDGTPEVDPVLVYEIPGGTGSGIVTFTVLYQADFTAVIPGIRTGSFTLLLGDAP